MESRNMVDWFKITCDLQKMGFSLKRIATSIGIPRATVVAWKMGREPRYSDGEKLVKLWIHVTGQSRETLPIPTMLSYHFRPNRENRITR